MISVIIPFYMENVFRGRMSAGHSPIGSSYLTDCLESLLDQRLPDMEVILIEDGSSEDISAVKRFYQNKLNLVCLRLDQRRGTAAARNAGLDAANGEFVYFLDCDDYLEEGVLSKLLDCAESHPKAGLIYGSREKTWFKRLSYLEGKSQTGCGKSQDSDENQQNCGRNRQDSDENQQNSSRNQQNSGRNQQNSSENQQNSNKSEDNGSVPAAEIPEKFKNPAEHLLIPSASVLNILFRREYLNQKKIRFDEELALYPDLPFTAAALAGTEEAAGVYGAVYVKRVHNDEVQYPSVDQEKRSDRTAQFIRAWKKAKETVISTCGADLTDGSDASGKMNTANNTNAAKGTAISDALDQELYTYILKEYTGRLHDRGKKVFTAEEFELVKTAAKEAGARPLKKFSRRRRAILKAVRAGNDKAAVRTGNRVVAWKKKEELFQDSRLFFRVIDRYLFQRLPIKNNTILFESFFGNSYSDSPKYIYQYMLEKFGDQYQYIWVLNRKNTKVPGNPKQVKQFSLKYFYYLARSKYWVINIRLPKWIEKKKGHVFLQTWHGTPLKKLVFDMEDVHLASSKSSYKMNFYTETRNWDYLISANPFSTERFMSAFLYERDKILEIGYPRNDILKAPGLPEKAAEIKRKLGLPEDKKLILYAPTWRDDEYYEAGKYKFDLKLNLQAMRSALGDAYAVLLRTHYLIAGNLNLAGTEGFAYNVSSYDDISELYLISDLCITDYSSVFFDYANLRRPILFYVYDLDKYRDVLRGFYINIETEVPGPLLYTTDEVIRAIESIEEVSAEYQQRYDRFYERFCSLDDGRASERAVKALLEMRTGQGN